MKYDILKQDIARINKKYALDLAVEFRKGALPDAARNDNAANAV